MKRWHILAAVIIALVIVLSTAIGMRYFDSLSATKHETDRWAAIEDVDGNRMAVEPTNDPTWSELVRLNQNGSRMFVGGIVERYGNKWGFRFKPDTVKVAQFTAEGLQGTIEYISTHIDDWLNGWAYVSSKIVEVHPQS